MHDSDSECEYTIEKNDAYLDNLVGEHQNLIEKYLRNHGILDAHKAKIEFLDKKKANHLKKIWFLKFEHYSLLEKKKVITQEIGKIILPRHVWSDEQKDRNHFHKA